MVAVFTFTYTYQGYPELHVWSLFGVSYELVYAVRYLFQRQKSDEPVLKGYSVAVSACDAFTYAKRSLEHVTSDERVTGAVQSGCVGIKHVDVDFTVCWEGVFVVVVLSSSGHDDLCLTVVVIFKLSSLLRYLHLHHPASHG